MGPCGKTPPLPLCVSTASVARTHHLGLVSPLPPWLEHTASAAMCVCVSAGTPTWLRPRRWCCGRMTAGPSTLWPASSLRSDQTLGRVTLVRPKHALGRGPLSKARPPCAAALYGLSPVRESLALFVARALQNLPAGLSPIAPPPRYKRESGAGQSGPWATASLGSSGHVLFVGPWSRQALYRAGRGTKEMANPCLVCIRRLFGCAAPKRWPIPVLSVYTPSL